MLSCRVVCSGIDANILTLLADENTDKAGAESAAARAGFSTRFEMVDSDILERRLENVHVKAIGRASAKMGTMALREPAAPYYSDSRQHYVENLVARALSANASDIHLQPTASTLEIRLRIDGALRTVERLPLESAAPLIAQIKVLARLPLAGKRMPQDGRLSVPTEGCNTDLRVSILPSIHGEAVVMRLGDDDAPVSMGQLHMPEGVRKPLETLLHRSGGLIIVGGPTGSGKTTTLYAMLREINDGSRKLISVEDPVERIIPGVMQVPVEQGGMGFGDAVRAMLRHSPDAILVGEIRDAPTAAAAAEAALTGHLVLASAHARDAVEVAVRLLDLGVSRHVLSCVMEAALTQRLVRVLCPECSRLSPPSAPLARAIGLGADELSLCRAPAGCRACGGTGYHGRRAIFGLVTMDERLRKALSAGAGAHALRELAAELGMPSLTTAARELVRTGITSTAEALVSASISETVPNLSKDA